MRTITVRDLTTMLSNQDPDARVVFTADYGDRCHTAQALPIRGEVEEVRLTKTAYSSSGFAIADDDDEEPSDVDGANETVLVIR